MKNYPVPPWPSQQQSGAGSFMSMQPRPDHGEESYQGHDLLTGKVAVITGGDSGIGRAVAIAYAREGADLVIGYLDENADAHDTARLIREAGRRVELVAGDLADPAVAATLIDRAMTVFGKLDIVVNCAGHQQIQEDIEAITDDEWKRHFDVNVHGLFWLLRAASPHLKKGASVIVTSSQNAIKPLKTHVPYAATKAAINNLAANFAQKWTSRGVRVNSVMPGATWTPMIVSSYSPDAITNYGADTPAGRPSQPAEYASAYVMFASDQASYTSGAMLTITSGTILL